MLDELDGLGVGHLAQGLVTRRGGCHRNYNECPSACIEPLLRSNTAAVNQVNTMGPLCDWAVNRLNTSACIEQFLISATPLGWK
eukprot:11510342-Alexandrium_andersonii.AAC.1